MGAVRLYEPRKVDAATSVAAEIPAPKAGNYEFMGRHRSCSAASGRKPPTKWRRCFSPVSSYSVPAGCITWAVPTRMRYIRFHTPGHARRSINTTWDSSME